MLRNVQVGDVASSPVQVQPTSVLKHRVGRKVVTVDVTQYELSTRLKQANKNKSFHHVTETSQSKYFIQARDCMVIIISMSQLGKDENLWNSTVCSHQL